MGAPVPIRGESEKSVAREGERLLDTFGRKVWHGRDWERDSDELVSDFEVRSLATALKCEDPSLAVQSQKEESDINEIVRRFGLTGKLPENVRVPEYGDFVVVDDYQSALNVVRQAGEAFMQMPAEVRARFDNDAGKFVDFCNNPKNLEEARALGIANPAPVVETSAVPVPEVKPDGGEPPK